MSQTDWNAVAYDDLSDPMFEWGMAVLGTLELRGNEQMLEQARLRLAKFSKRVEFVHASLQELSVAPSSAKAFRGLAAGVSGRDIPSGHGTTREPTRWTTYV